MVLIYNYLICLSTLWVKHHPYKGSKPLLVTVSGTQEISTEGMTPCLFTEQGKIGLEEGNSLGF